MTRPWFAKLFACRTARPAPTPRPRTRLGVESIEGREVPAGITVNTLADPVDSDPAVTSLREAITAANDIAGDDTIDFSVTGTINLTRVLPFLRKGDFTSRLRQVKAQARCTNPSYRPMSLSNRVTTRWKECSQAKVRSTIHRRSSRVVSRSALLVLGLLVAASPARGQTYSFTPIADTNSFGPIFRSFGNPAINSGGTVAFMATLGGPGGSGIYTGSGGATTTVADTGSPIFRSFGDPAINSGGTVAFMARRSGGSGIYTGRGGATTTVADTDSPTFGSFGNPAINGVGTVAFFASGDTGRRGIYTGSGGATTTVADSDSPTFSGFGNPAINAIGRVAFFANRDAGGSGIYEKTSRGITTVADTDSPTFSGFGSATSVNTGSTVAFLATRDAGGSGIYTGRGGITTTTVADTDSPTFSGFGNPVINEGGTVAFLAGRDAGGSGIYTNTGGTNVQVIGTGDALDGSTVTSLNFDRFGLNDSGQLAFTAFLADGRQGIYTASFSPVPEPAGLLACGAGLVAAARLRRRWAAG